MPSKQLLKAAKAKGQLHIGEDGACRAKLPIDDVDASGKLRFDIIHRLGCAMPWTGVDLQTSWTPAETLTALDEEGDLHVPVLGLYGNCYKCVAVPGCRDRVWDLCNACRKELLAARRGRAREQWADPDDTVLMDSKGRVIVEADFVANRTHKSRWVPYKL